MSPIVNIVITNKNAELSAYLYSKYRISVFQRITQFLCAVRYFRVVVYWTYWQVVKIEASCISLGLYETVWLWLYATVNIFQHVGTYLIYFVAA